MNHDEDQEQADGRWKAWMWAVVVLAGVEAVALLTLGIAYRARVAPYAVVWGDLGTWAQALATIAGLVFAGLSLLVAARQLRQNREAEQARGEEAKDIARRAVILKSRWRERFDATQRKTILEYSYELMNLSTLPVTNVQILVHEISDRKLADADDASLTRADDYFQAVAVGTLAPGEGVSGSLEVRNNDAVGLLEDDRVSNPDFFFTDAWGMHWRRPGTTWMRTQAPDEPQHGARCMCCGVLPQDHQLVKAALPR